MKGFDLQLGKESWNQIENISKFGYSHATIFSDFLDTCLLALLSLTENRQYPDFLERLKHNKLTGRYEEEYLQLVGKYLENKTGEKGKRPIDFMANAWGILQKETSDARQDILGEIFMAKVSFGEHGQFFTPTPVTDLMAQLVYSGKKESRETVSDPCCGSGRFFISVAKINPHAHFYGVDLSLICAKMTALNMWLFNLDADIYHGDSLAMKLFRVWNIRKGGLIFESVVEESQAPMPEPVKSRLQRQAEQQKLFEFDEGKEP